MWRFDEEDEGGVEEEENGRWRRERGSLGRRMGWR